MRQFKWGFRQKLLLTTALVAPGLIGYGGRKAYAACVNTGGSTYLCSGNETTTQTINANNADVTMDAGAIIDTSASAGNAITITGDGDLSFTNTAGGAIDAADNGLHIQASPGLATGSITVNTTQSVTGGNDGIFANNTGILSGALTINAVDVTGTNDDGIYARNFGTDLSITTTGTVTGYDVGIDAFNILYGALTINAADVTGTSDVGILARNRGTDLSVTTTGAVTGDDSGIYAGNRGSGALTISAADVTGTNIYGINARNYGTDLSITATGAVTGDDSGIFAFNDGSGALAINAVDVTGTNSSGIFARNVGTDLSITATGAVSGGSDGIYARNYGTDLSITTTGAVTGNNRGILSINDGSGALTISAAEVTGTNNEGIFANNNDGTDLSITATGAVTGRIRGITAINDGSGALTISAAEVTGTFVDGIYARNTGTDLSITATGAVTGGTRGIFARNNGTGALTISAADITGTNNDGIFASNNNGTDLSITTTGAVTGNNRGINAHNIGSGALTINAVDVTGTTDDGIYGLSGAAGADITVTGAITGGRDGIRLNSTGDNTITIAAGASVTGGTYSLNTTFNAPGSADTINLSGSLDGDAVFGAGDDVLNVFDTASFGASTTNIDGGADNDTIALLGDGDGTLDGGLHTNFEVLQKSGAGTWTLTGTHNFSTFAEFTGGTTELAGNLVSPEVTNAAILRVGGAGNTATGTGTITGNFTQTGAGSLAVDVNATTNTADKLTVTGSAALAGTVVPTVTGTVSGTERFTIVSAAGGATSNGLSVADTVGLDFELLFEGDDVVLTIEEILTVVEALKKLGNANQQSIAAYLNALNGANGVSDEIVALITSLLALPDEASLLAALNQLIPANLAGQIDTTVLSSLTFGNAMMSCGVSQGAHAIVREGQCSWVKVTGRAKQHDATFNALEFNERAGGIAGGMQFALPGEMRVGVAFDYEKSDTDIKGLAKSEADRAQGGVVFKNRWGGTSLAAAFTGGFGQVESRRTIALPTLNAVARGDQDVRFGGVKLRASQLLQMPGWYARPQVDLNATHVRVGSYLETGAGAFSLAVGGHSETVYSASPGLEIGSQVQFADGLVARPFVRAGATLFDDTSRTVLASFAGAPAGLGNFAFTTQTDKTVFDVGTGINLLWDNGMELRLNYDGHFSKNSQQHSGGLKLGFKF